MGDFSKNQPAPQSRMAEARDADTSGVPVTGFTEAPIMEDGNFNTEVGPGVPANSYKIR